MDKSTYILNAIVDAQTTIRATDTKAAALLAALLIPFSSIGKIWLYFSLLPSCFLTYFLGTLFSLFWLLALFTITKAIASIDNPRQHILDCDGAKGSFYLGGLFKLSERDCFINSTKVISLRGLSDITDEYPESICIDKELAFEHMKLVYIRDIKTHRLLSSIRFSSFAFTIGLITFLTVKVFSE